MIKERGRVIRSLACSIDRLYTRAGPREKKREKERKREKKKGTIRCLV